MLEYIDSLYSYAMILTDNESQAEDLVLKAYLFGKKASRYVEGHEGVRTLLLRTLRSIWFDASHMQPTRPHTFKTSVDDNTEGVVARTSNCLSSTNGSPLEPQQVQEVIRRLPVNDREVIFLRELEYLSYQEITILLDCSVDTVKAHLARARRKLRILLGIAKNR
jgi:RNA polymerase sigma-70 factor (ECF subfamily)